MAKTTHEDDMEMVSGESPRQQPPPELEITVKLRSTSKAARNDPKPPGYWRRLASPLSDYNTRSQSSSPIPQAPPAGSPPSVHEAPPPIRPSGITGSASPPSSAYAPHISIDGAIGSCVDGSGGSRLDPSAESHDLDSNDPGSDSIEDNALFDDLDSSFSDRSDPDYFAEWEWLEQIDVIATVAGTKVASCDAKLIRRDRMRGAFWIEMEEPTEETSKLAFELFDRYGRLDRIYCEHEIQKGTGVWGEELDHGDILLFESVKVRPQWRRQGVGTKIVGAILDKARPKSDDFFALAQPGFFTEDMGAEEGRENFIQKTLVAAEQFWRSLSFRRVGSSGWFAFTDDSEHPSRQLDATQDWNEPGRFEQPDPMPESIIPVMDTLLNPDTSGAECVRQIQKTFFEARETPSWFSSDEANNTILHAAIRLGKPDAIVYILFHCPELANIRNSKGYTPLEALRASLESYRTTLVYGTMTSVMSDKFTGFSQNDIACLAALTGTEIFDLSKLSDEDMSTVWTATDDAINKVPAIKTIRRTLRMKYGCTCESCIGGFLSPRMCYALGCAAVFIYHSLANDVHGDPGSFWVELHDSYLGFLPASVRQNLKTNKSMREGFTNMFAHITRCLEEDRLPTADNVLDLINNRTSEWPPVTKNYLQRGGTVAAVATTVFNNAMSQDDWAGDGYHGYVFREQIKELPTCRNDHEFGFVSGMCGYKRVSTIRFVDLMGNEIYND